MTQRQTLPSRERLHGQLDRAHQTVWSARITAEGLGLEQIAEDLYLIENHITLLLQSTPGYGRRRLPHRFPAKL